MPLNVFQVSEFGKLISFVELALTEPQLVMLTQELPQLVLLVTLKIQVVYVLNVQQILFVPAQLVALLMDVLLDIQRLMENVKDV
jgi:hypothetical protein